MRTIYINSKVKLRFEQMFDRSAKEFRRRFNWGSTEIQLNFKDFGCGVNLPRSFIEIRYIQWLSINSYVNYSKRSLTNEDIKADTSCQTFRRYDKFPTEGIASEQIQHARHSDDIINYRPRKSPKDLHTNYNSVNRHQSGIITTSTTGKDNIKKWFYCAAEISLQGKD